MTVVVRFFSHTMYWFFEYILQVTEYGFDPPPAYPLALMAVKMGPDWLVMLALLSLLAAKGVALISNWG